MSAPSIARTPIPKFSAKEIKTAELCSRALWYGIDFETGNKKTSDSEFIEIFAGPMYAHSPNARRFKPSVFQTSVHELIRAGKLNALYRAIRLLDFRKGVSVIHNQIFKIFFKARRAPVTTDRLLEGIKAIEFLSQGLVKRKNNNQLVLASRILFYLAPNLAIFNMNNRVARHFGLQSRPHHHYNEFQNLLRIGFLANQTKLNRCKLPMRHGKMSQKLWEFVKNSDWYQRRVLDIAILLRLNLVTSAGQLTKEIKAFENKIIAEAANTRLLAARKRARSRGAAAVRAIN